MPERVVTVNVKRRAKSANPASSWPLALGVVVLVAVIVLLCVRHGAEPTAAVVPVAHRETATASAASPRDNKTDAAEQVGEVTVEEPLRRNEAEAIAVEGGMVAEDRPSEPVEAEETGEGQEKRDEFRGLRYSSEQVLAMIISTRETGVPPLPISPESEEALRRSLLVALTNDIVIFDDESERTQENKERVADAKRQLADILQKGGSVVEAIKEYEAYVNEGAKVRAEVLEKITPEVDAITNDAEAVEYVESVNEALKKEDIPPIKLEEVGFEVEEPQAQ